MSAQGSTRSAGSESKRAWSWCLCSRTELTAALCAQCGLHVGNLRDVPIEYAGKHWHLSCLLDDLTRGPQWTDNPFSPLGGPGFHP